MAHTHTRARGQKKIIINIKAHMGGKWWWWPRRRIFIYILFLLMRCVNILISITHIFLILLPWFDFFDFALQVNTTQTHVFFVFFLLLYCHYHQNVRTVGSIYVFPFHSDKFMMLSKNFHILSHCVVSV